MIPSLVKGRWERAVKCTHPPCNGVFDFNLHTLPPDMYHDIGGLAGEHIVLEAHSPQAGGSTWM